MGRDPDINRRLALGRAYRWRQRSKAAKPNRLQTLTMLVGAGACPALISETKSQLIKLMRRARKERVQ
jgi:hypothetical protein